jgi:hypothetical protein
MTTVNYHSLPNSIVLNFEGNTITLDKTDGRYPKVIEAIKNNDLESIPKLVKPESILEGTPFTLVDGKVMIEGEGALPESLSKRILDLRREGLPIEPLTNFWANLKKNPSFNSRKQLYDFLEHNGHPLTSDGCFIAYRGVTEDFKDVHTGTFDNSVGSTCEVPRDSVDDNPNNTCSSGLHVACFDYARSFGSQLIEVKVNPADVVAVPTDYNGTKMRVCKFEVVNVGEKPRMEPLYLANNPMFDLEKANDMPTYHVDDESSELEELEEQLSWTEAAIQDFDTENDEVTDLIDLRHQRDDLMAKINQLMQGQAS